MAIIKLTFKDPDGVYDSIADAAKDSAEAIQGVSEDEREGLIRLRREKFQIDVAKWVKYGEYLSVEIDTDAGTARVVPVKS